MNFTKEFKNAISHLPSVEKDKLILKLLKKDLTLAKRLNFEIVDTRSENDRREEIDRNIKDKIKSFSAYTFNPGHFMMELRYLSGDITEHVKITKDKYGEVSLNLLLLNTALSLYNDKLLLETRGGTRKFCIYVIARSFKILILIKKMHQDLWIEFYEEIEKLGELISDNNHLMLIAIQNGFDVNWLINTEIPENIIEIHRDIRNQGYLGSRTYLRQESYANKKR